MRLMQQMLIESNRHEFFKQLRTFLDSAEGWEWSREFRHERMTVSDAFLYAFLAWMEERLGPIAAAGIARLVELIQTGDETLSLVGGATDALKDEFPDLSSLLRSDRSIAYDVELNNAFFAECSFCCVQPFGSTPRDREEQMVGAV